MRGAVPFLATLALLASCGRGEDSPVGKPISCALDGAAEVSEQCRVERSTQLLVVHRPDGGFYRLRPSADGLALETVDGAEPARSQLDGDIWQVTIGKDRYLVPVKDDAPAG